MTDDVTEGFLVLRELDDPISETDLAAAVEVSGKALKELRAEGADIRWNSLEVLRNEDDSVVGTLWHYHAESEDAIKEHAQRADLPVTKIMAVTNH